jgi:hypothetical protein
MTPGVGNEFVSAVTTEQPINVETSMHALSAIIIWQINVNIPDVQVRNLGSIERLVL